MPTFNRINRATKQGPEGPEGPVGPGGTEGPPGPEGPMPIYFAARGNTNAVGDVTFTFPADLFDAPPVVSVTVESGASCSVRIGMYDETECFVSVRAIPDADPGVVTVHLLAVETT